MLQLERERLEADAKRAAERAAERRIIEQEVEGKLKVQHDKVLEEKRLEKDLIQRKLKEGEDARAELATEKE